MPKIMHQIAVIFFLLSTKTYASDYYCSRSDIYLGYTVNIGTPYSYLTSGSGDISEAYIKKTGSASESLGKIGFKIDDCSDKEYECLHFLQRQTGIDDLEFYLFLPKVLEASKVYSFRGMTLATKVSSKSPFMLGKYSRPSSIPVVQATIWQKIGASEIPIKMTIESPKGVVFLDGINVLPKTYNIGETCALQSKSGFFSNVRIAKTKLSGVKVD